MLPFGDSSGSIGPEEAGWKWSSGSSGFLCLCSASEMLQRCLDGQHSDVRSILPRWPKNERITRCETALDPNTTKQTNVE